MSQLSYGCISSEKTYPENPLLRGLSRHEERVDRAEIPDEDTSLVVLAVVKIWDLCVAPITSYEVSKLP